MNEQKKIPTNLGDEIEKNQNYRLNDEIENKLKFYKGTKNKNLKPKH